MPLMPRRVRMCCLNSQCSSSQIQMDSPTSNKLLPPSEVTLSPATNRGIPTAQHPPSISAEPPPPQRSKSPLPNCESCIYKVCGCQVPPPSDRSTERESSLDIDLMDPVVVQALNIFGDSEDHEDVVNLTPKDLNERLNKIDFVSVYFQNYHHHTTRDVDKFSLCLDSPRTSDVENLPLMEVHSSPIYHSISSDISSSLPSSFQMDRGLRRRIFAPANSPISGLNLLSTDSDRSSERRVPERLQKEFSEALGFLFDGRQPEHIQTRLGPPSGKRHSQQHSCRRVKRIVLGDRPPCLGQEQSPVRDSPCVGNEDPKIPVNPLFRLVALTPNDAQQSVMVTPSPASQGHDATSLPTVRRGLRFSFEPRTSSDQTPMGIQREEGQGNWVEPTTCPSLPFVKSSAEKVRYWLSQQGTRLPPGQNSCSSSGGTSSRNSSLKLAPLFHKRRQRRRLYPVQRCQHLLSSRSEGEMRQEVDEEATSIDEEVLPQMEDAASSSQLHSDDISSSGFLADRSSTTRSSLRTTSDRVGPSCVGGTCDQGAVKVFCKV